MASLPRIIRRPAPDPQALAELQAEAEAAQHEAAVRREQLRPARRHALETGPVLNDLDAAVDCTCPCHPQPANPDHHDGGVSCPCQFTDEQRRAAVDQFLELSQDISDDAWADQQTRDDTLERLADDLGVTIRDRIRGAPFVIAGQVDGRGFYLRERHDHYRIVVSPPEEPDQDPWTDRDDDGQIEICSGDASDLEGHHESFPASALLFTVNQVRLYLRRCQCPHVDARQFCPDCGIDIAQADHWRIATTGDR